MELIVAKLIDFSGSKDEEIRDIAGLGDCFRPTVLDSLSEQLWEVIHILSTHEMGFVSLGLKPFFDRIW